MLWLSELKYAFKNFWSWVTFFSGPSTAPRQKLISLGKSSGQLSIVRFEFELASEVLRPTVSKLCSDLSSLKASSSLERSLAPFIHAPLVPTSKIANTPTSTDSFG